MWLVAGLGNPGVQYETTRHNVGFMVASALLKQYGEGNFQISFSGLSAKVTIGNTSAVVLKPHTFMNRSGLSVQPALAFYKIPSNNLIVVHDELDLPFGVLRVKAGGGHGGHNGLKDISRLIGPDFVRIRMGIGRPSFKGAEADYVLAPYRKEEIPELEHQIKTACDAVRLIIEEGVAEAQQQLNSKN